MCVQMMVYMKIKTEYNSRPGKPAGKSGLLFNDIYVCGAHAELQRFPVGVEVNIHPAVGRSLDRKSTRLNSSHPTTSRMPSSA